MMNRQIRIDVDLSQVEELKLLLSECLKTAKALGMGKRARRGMVKIAIRPDSSLRKVVKKQYSGGSYGN